MAAVAPGDALSVSNPVLDTFTAAAGFLADPYALAFQIFDVRNDDVAPVQVFPALAGTRHAVNLVADRIGIGHFAAAWTVPAELPVGRYEIRWFLTQAEGDRERAWRRTFDVLAQVPNGEAPGYALVSDVRDEGVSADVRTRRIVEAIARASELVRMWTGRDFMPTYKVFRVDGPKNPLLILDEPICAMDSVAFVADLPSVMPRENYVVYARHLTSGLLSEDDRESPKIEFVRGPSGVMFPITYPLVSTFADLRSPRISKAQEIELAGVFGYTDPEPRGCPVGVTPANIRKSTVLIAARDLPKVVSQPDQAFDAAHGHRVKRQRTREQEIEWHDRFQGDQVAPFTGDPRIDSLLLSYARTLTGTGI